MRACRGIVVVIVVQTKLLQAFLYLISFPFCQAAGNTFNFSRSSFCCLPPLGAEPVPVPVLVTVPMPVPLLVPCPVLVPFPTPSTILSPNPSAIVTLISLSLSGSAASCSVSASASSSASSSSLVLCSVCLIMSFLALLITFYPLCTRSSTTFVFVVVAWLLCLPACCCCCCLFSYLPLGVTNDVPAKRTTTDCHLPLVVRPSLSLLSFFPPSSVCRSFV